MNASGTPTSASDQAPTIAPITPDQYEAVLPLVADYQRFYGVKRPDPGRNATFFRRFIHPSEDGLLLGAWANGDLAGYACLYWTFSSVTPGDVVLLNDLFVSASHRGRGIGERLIDASVKTARDRDASALRWWTEVSNRRAQRLYEQVHAERSTWFEYEISLAGERA